MVWSALAQAPDPECFNPLRDDDIALFLQPNTLRKNPDTLIRNEDLREDKATIRQIHAKILEAYTKYHYDPRLIYARMLGESNANPFQKQDGGGGGSGLFQITGRPYQRKKCGAARPPRLCQVEYYVDVYMEDFVKKAESGCRKGVKWERYSTIDQLSYVSLGACPREKVEYKICTENQSYTWSGACRLMSQVINWKNINNKGPRIPLCNDYLEPRPATDQDLPVGVK